MDVDAFLDLVRSRRLFERGASPALPAAST
jgi:hypothetical protein